MNQNTSTSHGIKTPRTKSIVRKAFNLLNREHKDFRNIILGMIALPFFARIGFEISVYNRGIVYCSTYPFYAAVTGFVELFSVVTIGFLISLLIASVVKSSIRFSRSLLEQ